MRSYCWRFDPVWRFAMVDDEELRAKLAKVEALFRGPPVRASGPPRRPRWTGCKIVSRSVV